MNKLFKNITRLKIIILVFTLLYILLFGISYLERANYEFIMYAGSLIIFGLLIFYLNSVYNLSGGVLIGISLWGLLHMSGGYFRIGQGVLYEYWLLPFLRYDMFVHCFGFGFATLFSYYILRPYLKIRNKIPLAVSVLIVFIGMGIGALNEIIEFILVLTLPKTGVGGYDNTMWDIVFNTIGAIIAVVYINVKKK
jgi:uncharacterized membrane protein YjdF